MGWDNNKYPSNWNSIRKRILKRDGYNCTECGTSDEQLHVHHIKPISEGGSHSPKNLRTLCHSCHENVHGHRIPTKGGSYNTSHSFWKKMVWLPSWESDNSEDVDWDKIEETFIKPLRQENSRSKGDWVARQIGVFTVFFVMILPGLWVMLDTGIFLEEPIISTIVVFIMPIILMLIPIIGIPLLIIALLAGIIVWMASRYGIERYYGSSS